MNKLSLLFVMLCLCACDRKIMDLEPKFIPIPKYNNINVLNSSTNRIGPAIGGIHGLLTVGKVDKITRRDNDTVYIASNIYWATAIFPKGSGYVDAGSVTLNKGLIKHNTIEQTKADVLWKESNNNTWVVAGGDEVPAINYVQKGNLPLYLGNMPTSISTTEDLEIVLDEKNALDMKMAQVIVSSGGMVINTSNLLEGYGKLVLKAQEMKKQTDDGLMLGEYLVVHLILYNYDVASFGNKQYGFAKANEYVSIATLH